MAEYGEMEVAISGLKYGLGGKVESFSCKESDGISFGMPVFGYVGDASSAYRYSNDVGKLAFDADFEASNVITITVNGIAAGDVTFTGTHDATSDLVVAAVAALSGVECVLDSTDATNKTFLIRTKGETAVVTEAITGGSGQATGTVTAHSGQVFVGVAMSTQKSASLDVATNQGYEYQDTINVVSDGELYVDVVETVEAQNEAYVDIAGAGIGVFSNAGVAVNARYRGNADAAGLARLQVRGQTEMTYASSF